MSKLACLMSLTILILFCSINSPAIANNNHQTQPSQFRSIEQPISLKIGVATGGLMLIGLELWWFLHRKKSS